MVQPHLVTAKLVELAERAGRARTRCPPSVKALAADPDALDLVSFNLMLAVQACADIASHLVADEGWPPASTLRAAFERLGEHGVLTPATVDGLRRAVGLRNVVAHGYAGVDVAAVFAGATQSVADLDAFAREVAAWVAGRT